jgi:glycosyltransferase involved in cell wall biosynthesis
MMSEPKVSIGMPVYNGEELLPETLDSILAQTFDDLEVVISDNASTDATSEICRAYVQRDERIRYERNDVGIPIPKNFGRAFRLSRGRYFKWQAHDDLLRPDFLTRCVEILDEDPSTLLAGARCGLIEKDGSPVPFDAERGLFVTSYGEQIPAPRPAGSDALASPERVERFRSLLFDVHGPDEGKYIFGLIRSNALSATPLNQGYIGGDKVLLGRLSLAGRFREVREELFFRRYLPGHVGAVGRGTWSGRIRLARRFAPERRLVLFPLADQVGGYFRAIWDADITEAEKVRCAATVLEKVADVGTERIKRLPTRIRAAIARG